LNRQLERLRVVWTGPPTSGLFEADGEPVKVKIERVRSHQFGRTAVPIGRGWQTLRRKIDVSARKVQRKST
jgi:hypothetical protein